MDKNSLKKLLDRATRRKVGVLGDFCVDAYWELRPEQGERSIETGILTTPVGSARYYPGGAGNLAANIRALGAKDVACFGALGGDPFGEWLRRTLRPDETAGDFLIRVGRKNYHTPVYCKPLLNGCEQSRFDLGNLPLEKKEEDELLEVLDAALPGLELLIVNQQLRNGIHSERFRREFAARLRRAPETLHVVFDGREHLDAYPDAVLKINSAAASLLAFGAPGAPPEKSGAAIVRKGRETVVVTDGENGCFVFASGGVDFIPAIRYDGPVDTVGAGDSFTAGFALALAGGAAAGEAAEFGSACAAVTVRKLGQTGVPSPEELIALFT